ncbi:hypothetical protein BU16DRAFT_585529 [Lophium mytilinum]|uniref:Uncharacterized protein n=1 Tax=Lophium mytilinum TaxID=390894 RepID=A0A6A6QE16_9PEZI|nr:hypothetical protein BU16DRAFT_585529 [Lophium mytilinum]
MLLSASAEMRQLLGPVPLLSTSTTGCWMRKPYPQAGCITGFTPVEPTPAMLALLSARSVSRPPSPLEAVGVLSSSSSPVSSVISWTAAPFRCALIILAAGVERYLPASLPRCASDFLHSLWLHRQPTPPIAGPAASAKSAPASRRLALVCFLLRSPETVCEPARAEPRLPASISHTAFGLPAPNPPRSRAFLSDLSLGLGFRSHSTSRCRRAVRSPALQVCLVVAVCRRPHQTCLSVFELLKALLRRYLSDLRALSNVMDPPKYTRTSSVKVEHEEDAAGDTHRSSTSRGDHPSSANPGDQDMTTVHGTQPAPNNGAAQEVPFILVTSEDDQNIPVPNAAQAPTFGAEGEVPYVMTANYGHGPNVTFAYDQGNRPLLHPQTAQYANAAQYGNAAQFGNAARYRNAPTWAVDSLRQSEYGYGTSGDGLTVNPMDIFKDGNHSPTNSNSSNNGQRATPTLLPPFESPPSSRRRRRLAASNDATTEELASMLRSRRQEAAEDSSGLDFYRTGNDAPSSSDFASAFEFRQIDTNEVATSGLMTALGFDSTTATYQNPSDVLADFDFDNVTGTGNDLNLNDFAFADSIAPNTAGQDSDDFLAELGVFGNASSTGRDRTDSFDRSNRNNLGQGLSDLSSSFGYGDYGNTGFGSSGLMPHSDSNTTGRTQSDQTASLDMTNYDYHTNTGRQASNTTSGFGLGGTRPSASDASAFSIFARTAAQPSRNAARGPDTNWQDARGLGGRPYDPIFPPSDSARRPYTLSTGLPDLSAYRRSPASRGLSIQPPTNPYTSTGNLRNAYLLPSAGAGTATQSNQRPSSSASRPSSTGQAPSHNLDNSRQFHDQRDFFQDGPGIPRGSAFDPFTVNEREAPEPAWHQDLEAPHPMEQCQGRTLEDLAPAPPGRRRTFREALGEPEEEEAGGSDFYVYKDPESDDEYVPPTKAKKQKKTAQPPKPKPAKSSSNKEKKSCKPAPAASLKKEEDDDKSPKGPRKLPMNRKMRAPRGKLMRPNQDFWEKCCLGFEYEWRARHGIVPYGDIAEHVDSYCTGNGLQQALWKLRRKRLAANLAVPPAPPQTRRGLLAGPARGRRVPSASAPAPATVAEVEDEEEEEDTESEEEE